MGQRQKQKEETNQNLDEYASEDRDTEHEMPYESPHRYEYTIIVSVPALCPRESVRRNPIWSKAEMVTTQKIGYVK